MVKTIDISTFIEGGLYYDIPWTNFMGWFVVAFLLHAVIWGLEKKEERQAGFERWEKRTYWLYGMMIFMFMVTAVAAGGLWGAILLTFVLTAILYAFAERRPKKV